MIKSFVSVLLCGIMSLASYAQIGQGGIPNSLKPDYHVTGVPQKVTLHSEKFQSLLDQSSDLGSGQSQAIAYQVGWGVPANLDVARNGTWTYLGDGSKIWRLEIEVPNAKASAVYYNKFFLPEGVSLYLTNDNKRQILGAYTSKNNPVNGVFSNEPIQGSTIHMELNVASYVDVADIQLGVYFIGAYYKGVDYDVAQMGAVTLADTIDGPPFNVSAVCHKEAMCPQGDLAAKSRTSAARIIIAYAPNQGLGYCSGSLINNTGNAAGGACKPLFLTASHCDTTNSHADTSFQYWQFRFNYQKSDCGSASTVYPTDASAPVMTNGAKFTSRSHYPTFTSGTSGSSRLVQDFLLLELNDAIPSDYYLAGWNRNTNIASPAMADYYTAFYGFHHPGGDLKKMSYVSTVSGNGTFNQTTVPNTHWSLSTTFGGTSGGSSGSGLYDVDGLLIGDLSGGPDAFCANDGRDFGINSLYSKLSYGWTNDFDQTQFPAFAGSASQLRLHLDPVNSGMSKLGPAKAGTCAEMPPVGIKNTQLDKNAINIYPSVSDGKVTVQFNLTKAVDVTLKVYNMLGMEVAQYYLPNTKSDSKLLNIGGSLPNGVYIINVQTNIGQSNIKVVLNR